jgi:hypothetical protein
MKFFSDLLMLLASRRDAWLRPIIIVLLVVGALMLAGGVLEVFLPRSEPDRLPALSRDHYRQDGAFLNR